MYKMNFVFLDANFLLVPSQFQIDIYQEIRELIQGKFQFILVPEVIDELNAKTARTTSTKFKRNVAMALKLLDAKKHQTPQFFKELQKSETKVSNVDDYLVTLAHNIMSAEKCGVFISTNDKELKQKASKYGIQTIYLRQKKFIELSP